MRHVISSLALLTLAAGCMTSPYHNQQVPHKNSSVPVEGWALSPSANVRAQCRPYFIGGSWTTVKTFTSSATPLNANGESVYHVVGNMVVPNACWFEWHDTNTTELRFTQQGNNGATITYQMYDEDGVDCIYEQFGDGVPPTEAGMECDPTGSIYIHALN